MKKFLMSLTLVLVAFAVTACGCEKEKDPDDSQGEDQNQPIANTNENVIKDQEVNGLNFTNTSLVYDKTTLGIVFTTQVENKTNAAVELGLFCLVAKDAEGNEISRYANYVGDTIESGVVRTVYTNAEADVDKFNKIKSVEYVLDKNCMKAE